MISAGRPGRLFALGAASLVVVGAALGVLERRRTPPLPVLGTVPDFSLQDHRGARLTLAALRGHPWIADFIFTRCSGVCPAMTSRLSRLQARAPQAARFVSFSVDPASDTPQVLARYAREFQAGERWRFVTGAQSALYALATEGFKLGAFEAPPGQSLPADAPFLHSAKYVLVDRRARIRGYYDSAEAGAVERLAADLDVVAAEPE